MDNVKVINDKIDYLKLKGLWERTQPHVQTLLYQFSKRQ